MTTTPQPTPRADLQAAKAFREYLAVHPDACTGMGGHAMDDMALDLARIALDFPAEPAPTDDLTKRLIAACRHDMLTWEDRKAVGEAIALLQATPRSQADALMPAEGEVLVVVSGFTGSGKSAVAGEIEIMCRALGLPVEWPDGAEEKGLTGADWQTSLEMYKPRVRIVEKNVRAAACEAAQP